MDHSVISFETIAKNFNQQLMQKGFTRAISREMLSGQCSNLQMFKFQLMGLVVSGDIQIELNDVHQDVVRHQGFLIPANVAFQVRAGHEGACLLIAKKRTSQPDSVALLDDF